MATFFNAALVFSSYGWQNENSRLYIDDPMVAVYEKA
jgi:hypothetical protein